MYAQVFKIAGVHLPNPEPGPEDQVYGYEVKNQCSHCQHLNRDNPVACKAFPAGIPLIILMGMWDHTYEYDQDGVNDGGITFSKID